MSYTSFSGEEFNAFREIKDPRPLNMLNLVKVHKEVEYPNGEVVSGVEAYKRYGRLSFPIFENLGGKIIWRGEMLFPLIGPSEEKWDFCFIAEYPSLWISLDEFLCDVNTKACDVASGFTKLE